MEHMIRERLLDFHRNGVPAYTRRDGGVPLLPNVVTTLVGGRKTGKTFRAYQAIDEQLSAGAIPELGQVCYLHFDDEALSAMTQADLGLVDKVFLSLQSSDSLQGPLLFVFDEIHRVDGWEQFVLRLARNAAWRVLVTGSSSELEADRVGRQLRGKAFTRRLHPLSFREFLRFQESELTPGRYSTAEAATARRLLGEYLEIGSYPALALLAPGLRREMLQSYFASIVAADFIFARDIANPVACKTFLRELLQKNACPYTHRKQLRNLAAMGHRLGPATVSDWFHWAEDSYFVEGCCIHTESQKRREQNFRKVYAVDWALANAVSTWTDGRSTRSLECLVYWHLRRAGLEVTYDLVGTDKHEIDFLAARPNEEPHLAIQVCYRLANRDVVEREVRGFERLRRRYPGIECVVVTGETPAASEATVLSSIPAWQWCLECLGHGGQ